MTAWRFVRHHRLFLAICLLGAFSLFYFALLESGLIDSITDGEILKQQVLASGYLGPLLIIALMAMAIVFNPIPSAPIALVAGAVYGHTFGTIYIVLGAEIGAVIAFTIARLAGHDLMCRWLGDKISLGWLGSQNSLTGLVFVSRLLPFVSFDLVSYGAGLTPIKPWRFVLATFFGLIPASFLLAHFGGSMAGDDLNQAMFYILLAGVIVVLPFLPRLTRQLRQTGKRTRGECGSERQQS